MKYPRWLLFGGSIVLVLVVSAALPVVSGMGDQLPPEVRRALDAPEKVVLYSIDPMGAIVDRLEGRKSGETFHEYKVLGHTALNQEQSATAIREFESAATNWSLVVSVKGCFNPRHALRVTSGGHTYDLLLCYECRGMEVYRDDDPKLMASLSAKGSPKVLNGLLSAAGVPLAMPGQ